MHSLWLTDSDNGDEERDPVVQQTVTVQGQRGGRPGIIMSVDWCLTHCHTTSTSTTRWVKLYPLRAMHENLYSNKQHLEC